MWSGKRPTLPPVFNVISMSPSSSTFDSRITSVPGKRRRLAKRGLRVSSDGFAPGRRSGSRGDEFIARRLVSDLALRCASDLTLSGGKLHRLPIALLPLGHGFFRRNFNALPLHIELKPGKKTEVYVRNPDQRESGYDVATPVGK